MEKEAYGTKDTTSGNATSDAMTDEQLASFLMSGGGGLKTYGKSAYMLVYERLSKKDLRVVVPQAKAEGGDEIKEEEEKVEHVKFREVSEYVPDWISKDVVADNKTFIVE